MAAIDEIYRYLNEIAPFSTAMDFDNAGFLVGDGKTEVTKALVTLDITAQSVRQAREKGAQLIVSHHPVIFHRRSSPNPQKRFPFRCGKD